MSTNFKKIKLLAKNDMFNKFYLPFLIDKNYTIKCESFERAFEDVYKNIICLRLRKCQRANFDASVIARQLIFTVSLPFRKISV